MATLIVVWNSNGVIGRCDARCYDARSGTPCTCCCGGVNHSGGLTQAVKNTGAALERATKFAASQSKVLDLEVYVAGQVGLPMGAMV